MQVKSRHHLRSDGVQEIREALAADLGVDIDGESFELVELEGTDFDLVLVDGEPLVFYTDEEPFLSVKGANNYDPDSHVVTVDTGAISFVSDGADIMRPGIVDADDDITEGDLVAIAEESHEKILAIGRALVDGTALAGDSGKVVKSIHYVGDDLYEFGI